MELDHNELTILANAVEWFIADQRQVLEQLRPGVSTRSARVHLELEIEAAEALKRRIDEQRY